MKNDKIIKITRVAKKYYESHMDQKIIAQEEGISVSTVSRMLKKAEEMGYIKITVEYPVLSNEEVSDSLKKRYGLKKYFLFLNCQARQLLYRKMYAGQQQRTYLLI